MRTPNVSKILFPWESRGGVGRYLRLGRLRPFLILVGVLGFIALVAMRERRMAGERQTRATLLGARSQVEAYMADHDGGCPESLKAVGDHAQKESLPSDAWGRPLRLICPGRFEGAPYELLSDGPDGEPGGLDRIE
ncbi:MAG TPA: type II secretion system protein GspG [Polyangiaceae bacterium]